MYKNLPDKWVRKAVYDAVDGISVDSNIINCYDTKVTQGGNGDAPRYYVLMTTQTAEVAKENKCEWFWDSSILLDIVTLYDSFGNQGSRLLLDNIADAVREQIMDLELDVASGLKIVWFNLSFPADLVSDTTEEIAYRKFIRIELRIA